MSIDATVECVLIHENGGGQLLLVDRIENGRRVGNRGQRTLVFESAPEEATSLNGLDVWGSANTLMLGEVEIAERIGYTRIRFCDRDQFKEAVKKYHDRMREKQEVKGS